MMVRLLRAIENAPCKHALIRLKQFGMTDTWSLKRGGRIRKVVAYQWWLLKRDGRLREVVA